MRKELAYLLVAFILGWLLAVFLRPFEAQAASVSWDRFQVGSIRPINLLDTVFGNIFNATSTTQASVFPYASTTALSVSGLTSGRCVQTSTGGLLTVTGTTCAAASTPGGTSGQVQYNASGSFGGVATGTISNGTGISVTAGQSVIGSGLTITNTGVTSVSGSGGTSVSASTGAVTISSFSYPFPSNATTTALTFNAAFTVLNPSTSQGAGTYLGTDATHGIKVGYYNANNYALWAGGVTPGATNYGFLLSNSGTSAQFNSTDNVEFNISDATKVAIDNTGAVTLASLTNGIVKSTSGKLSNAANGTDYTLLTAITCSAGQFFNAATAAGVFTCGTPSGTGSGLATSSPVASSNLLVYSTSGAGNAYGVATGTVSGSGAITATAGQSIIGSGLTIGCTNASSGVTGCLTGTDWNTFNGKQAAGFQISTTSPISQGNLAYFTGVTPTSLGGVATGTVSNGTGISVTAGQSVIGSGLTITNTSPLSGLTTSFPLSFSNPAISYIGLSTSSPGITSGQPVYATGVNTIASVASSTFLTSIGGQASGNYITALTGDVTATGPNSVAATLATVNSNVGSFTNANITVNGKGLVTAASNGTGGGTGIGTVSTSTADTYQQIPWWNTTNGYPATLAASSYFKISTSTPNVTLAVGAPATSLNVGAIALSYSGSVTDNTITLTAQGGTSGARNIVVPNANGTICLNSTCSILATTSPFLANQSVYTNNSGGLVTVATSSVSAGVGINITGTAGALIGGSNITITNSGVQALTAGSNISVSGSTGAVTITGGTTSKWATSTTPSLSITPNGGANTGVGIGTTTPNFGQLVVASSTGNQLLLRDGAATTFGWALSNFGGVLNIGTTTASTGATSTPSGIQVSSQATTQVGIASTTPWRTLDVTGTVAFNGLTTSAGTVQGLCLVTATKEVTANTTSSCVVSSRRFKDDIQYGTLDGIDAIRAMQPVTFRYKDSPASRIGFIAEDMQAIDPRLVGLDSEGLPSSIDDAAVLALVVQAVKEIQMGKVTRSAEENWQWYALGLLATAILIQQKQIYNLKRRG